MNGSLTPNSASIGQVAGLTQSREPGMQTAMVRQGALISELESAVSRLYQRLQHVIRPQEASNVSQVSGDVNSGVPPLINAVHEDNNRIRTALESVEQIIDSLEI